MDMNRELEPLKWNAFEPRAKLSHNSSGKLPKKANDYVTWDEMQEFQRSIYELMGLFLESYLTNIIELETPYCNIHLN